MVMWKEPAAPAAPPVSPPPANLAAREGSPSAASGDLRRANAEAKESVIASDISIEGKIEGSGNVRIAGNFKGDVSVQGNLTVEVGARVTGQVKANQVVVAGELTGNIDSAVRVELLQTGALIGDVKAGAFTVASGARMRGNVEFGWGDKAFNGPGGNA
jgi:cytoskeletal protein CcmA (bactofilin family)